MNSTSRVERWEGGDGVEGGRDGIHKKTDTGKVELSPYQFNLYEKEATTDTYKLNRLENDR